MKVGSASLTQIARRSRLKKGQKGQIDCKPPQYSTRRICVKNMLVNESSPPPKPNQGFPYIVMLAWLLLYLVRKATVRNQRTILEN